MRRRSWLIGVCLAVVVAAGGLIANAAVTANAAPVPAACPTRQPGVPGYSGLLTSQLRLVPFMPEHALLCRYNGMNGSAGSPAWDLAGTARVDGAKAAQLAASTNAAAHLPNLGVVNCPMDDASHMDVYYWDSSHHIRVRFWTSGCERASNGGVISPSITESNIVPELEQLTPRKEPAAG